MATRWYLAGPMTGPPNHGYDLFQKAADNLRAKGFNIASPHEIDYDEANTPRGGHPYKVYMKGGLDLLFTCDGIILMDGFPDSKGAMIERAVAIACGYDILYYSNRTGELTGVPYMMPA